MEFTRLNALEKIKKAEDCYMHQNYAESRKCASEVLIISQKTNDPKGEVQALRILAWSLYGLGKFKSGVKIGNEFQKVAVEVKDRKLTAEAYKFLACSFCRMGDYEKSEENANISLSIAKQIGDEDLARRVHHVLSKLKEDKTSNGSESPNTTITFGDSFLEGDACMDVLANLRTLCREFPKNSKHDEFLNNAIVTGQSKAGGYESLAPSRHPKKAPAVNRGLGARRQEGQGFTYIEEDYDDDDDDDDNGFRQSSVPNQQSPSVAEEVKAVRAGRRGTEKVYNTTAYPRGKALIINNTTFEGGWEPRYGSEGDVGLLEGLFRRLYLVTRTRENLTRQALEDELKRVSWEDHSSYNCFVMFIMSHGVSGAVVCSDGKRMTFQEIRDTICECETLRDKPKIIFIVACRGTLQDEGISVASAGKPSLCDVDNPPDPSNQQVPSTPTQADCLVVFSTVDRYVSYRLTGGGSIYVRCFVEAFDERVSSDDLDDILKTVNYKVSKYEVTNKEVKDHSKTFKQVPEVLYTLLKKVYL